MNEHNVSVFLEPSGRYLVETYSRTVDLARIMDGAPQAVPAGASTAELGAAVLEGLRRTRYDMPRRATIPKPAEDFLRFAGKSSWGAFVGGVRAVGVRSDYDHQLTEFQLTPETNEGPRGGFTPIVELIRTVPYESPEQLGQAVLDALEQATA